MAVAKLLRKGFSLLPFFWFFSQRILASCLISSLKEMCAEGLLPLVRKFQGTQESTQSLLAFPW